MSSKKRQCLPLGDGFKGQYITLDAANPQMADAFAAAAVRFVTLCKEPAPDSVPSAVWEQFVQELARMGKLSTAGTIGARARWVDPQPQCERNATAMQPQCEPQCERNANRNAKVGQRREEKTREEKTDGIEPAPPVEPSGDSVLKSSISSPSPAVGLSPFSAVDDPVEVALKVCGVWDDGNRRCFGARLKECGRPAFLATVERFKSELEAGEAVRNKAAALNARLRAASGVARPTPPQEPPAPQQTPAGPVSRPSTPRPAPATAWAQGIAREVFARNPAANWDALQEAAWNWATDNANGRGLTQAEQEALLNAWEALDAKRQREAPDDPPGELPPAVAGIVARLAGKVDSVHPARQSKSVEFEFVQRYLSDNPTATFHEVERAAERELTEKYSLDEIENAFLELEQ